VNPFEMTRVFDAPRERKTFDEGRDGMKQGWTGTMDQFAAYFANA
jgi:uncharacterized protein YndB with AHSA1/START domain